MSRIITTDFFTTVGKENAKISKKILKKKVDISTEKTEAVSKLRDELGAVKGIMFFFLNARSALYHSLKACGIWEGDEVLVCGWTCVSVVNAVLQTWATPVYVDISPYTLGIDEKHVNKRMRSATKAIIIQHNFGIPTIMWDIEKTCKDKGIFILEDNAHSFWINSGIKADVQIYSFGRDKVLSSVWWWLAVVSSRSLWKKYDEVKTYFKNINFQDVSEAELKKYFNYNFKALKASKYYWFFSIGKAMMARARKKNIFPEILSQAEKNCDFKDFDYRYPDSLFPLLNYELSIEEEVMNHRKEIAEMYMMAMKTSKIFTMPTHLEKGNFFRIPLHIMSLDFEDDIMDELIYFMKSQWIYLWTYWSGVALAPRWSSIEKAKISGSSIPVVQGTATRTVFLPNHRNVTREDAEKVIKLLQYFDRQHA